MSHNILFWPDINYEPGHWRPVMAMAKRLKEEMKNEQRECSIKFLCTPECRTIIENVGIKNDEEDIVRLFDNDEIETVLEDLFPVGYSSLASERPEEARSRMEHCLRIARGEFDELLMEFKPHLLIAGFFVSMEALLIKYRYDNVISHKLSNAPLELDIMITTTYLRHPSEDPAITSLRFLAHHSREQTSKLMRIVFEDEDEIYSDNGNDSDNEIEDINDDDNENIFFAQMQEFIKPLETVTEMITCPRELDHDDFVHTRVDTHYVEPCILDTDCENDSDSDSESSDSPNLNSKTIYASAGSRVRDYVESAKTMFRMLKDMINTPQANISKRKLEMAVGYSLKEEFDKEWLDSSRIEIVEWANQTARLKSARSAVIHGGLATIKECIYFGIVPIVVPLGKDQMDNALRVVNKEVGAMIMLGTMTPEKLYNAIMTAEMNLDIRKSIDRMQKIFIEYEREAPSIGYIKAELGV